MNAWEHKLRFLGKHADATAANALAARVAAWAEEGRKAPSAVGRALALDVTYLWFKQKAWRASVYFGDFFADYLQKDYGIGRAAAEELYESLHAWAPQRGDDGALNAVSHLDRDFLRAVFVTGALSQDEGELELDLGFGRTVMAILRQVIQDLQGDDAEGKRLAFSPEINTAFAETMMAFAAWLNDDPHALESYRLAMALGSPGLGDEAGEREARAASFQALVALGLAGKATGPEALAKAFARIPGFTAAFGAGEDGARAWLARAEAADACYPWHAGQSAPRWRLSPWAQRLTAAAAAKSLRWPRRLDAAWLKEWPADWQKALVPRLARERPEAFAALVTEGGTAWHPEAFLAAYREAAPRLGAEDAARLREAYLAQLPVASSRERWRDALSQVPTSARAGESA